MFVYYKVPTMAVYDFKLQLEKKLT